MTIHFVKFTKTMLIRMYFNFKTHLYGNKNEFLKSFKYQT